MKTKKNTRKLRFQSLTYLVLGVCIGIIATLVVQSFLYEDGKNFSSKDRLCNFVAQSYLRTVGKPDVWNQAVAIETRLHNLCLTDLSNNEITVKPRDQVIEYETVEDDTLENIAERFGISSDTIRWENNIKGNEVVVGEVLRIPPVTGVVHIVEEGDTIYSIADQYNTRYESIVNFPYNEFEDYETFKLKTGSTLFVPDGKK